MPPLPLALLLSLVALGAAACTAVSLANFSLAPVLWHRRHCPHRRRFANASISRCLRHHRPRRRLPAAHWHALRGGRLGLADGLQLRRSRLMQVNRIELTGFGPNAVDRLKAMGLFSEIISWKLRLFIPDDPVAGSQVLERLLARHPLARIIDRKAA